MTQPCHQAPNRATPSTVDRLSPRQSKLLAALLSEPSVADAASSAEVPLRTCFNWLKDETFCAAYREARREALRQATSQLTAAAGVAVQRLREIVDDYSVSPAARVSACRCILEMAARTVELDLAERLAQIEATLAGLPQPGANGRSAHYANG